jgi:hypothetical protein
MVLGACKSSTTSDSYKSEGRAGSGVSCTEPGNPYDVGSGHYAGFEWAENNHQDCAMVTPSHLSRAVKSISVRKPNTKTAKPVTGISISRKGAQIPSLNVRARVQHARTGSK